MHWYSCKIRPKTGDSLCKECFFFAFEEEVHHTITSAKLFSCGGKDSTVLAHLMKLLNERYKYGLKLVLLSIDEGITGYRDDSLETVKRNEQQYNIPLKILSYEELYGWTMDKIVQKASIAHVGRRNNCTFCGVFRRQALDRGARLLGVDKLVTGHNADDIAETIVMNILRGDVARLQRCCAVETGSEGHLPRSKPFKYTYEKEIVMYAYFKKLDYFSTECVYSPNAYRGHARTYIKDLEKIRPTAILDIIHSGECLTLKEDVKLPCQSVCQRCGHVSSQAVCKACVLLEGLNKGRPRLGVGKSSKVKRNMGLNPHDLICENAQDVASNPAEKVTVNKEASAYAVQIEAEINAGQNINEASDNSDKNSRFSEELKLDADINDSSVSAKDEKPELQKSSRKSSSEAAETSATDTTHNEDKITEETPASGAAKEAKLCASQLTSIEDIGSEVGGKLCSKGDGTAEGYQVITATRHAVNTTHYLFRHQVADGLMPGT
ncbi:hypothetical protein HAZT_HAZT006766 [Hyalella azteca]|uniref:Cytoplasmic tRNA 2-thiolation protein 1 n=1 Tax=Hyalella azteca TaxID=294128 RepID=A0A6A0H9L0_HYAAZ|nr:hypothetical protein HAZT_HAZT006766 [Hyalella azteca]